jgi:hypothetical protein
VHGLQTGASVKATQQEGEEDTVEKEEDNEWEVRLNSESEDGEVEQIEGLRIDQKVTALSGYLTHNKKKKKAMKGARRHVQAMIRANHKTAEGYILEASEIQDASKKQAA